MIASSTAANFAFSSLLMGLVALFAIFCVLLLFVWVVFMPVKAFWRMIKSFLNPNIGHK